MPTNTFTLLIKCLVKLAEHWENAKLYAAKFIQKNKVQFS